MSKEQTQSAKGKSVDGSLNKDAVALLARRIYDRMERVKLGDATALPIVTEDERKLPEAYKAEQEARADWRAAWGKGESWYYAQHTPTMHDKPVDHLLEVFRAAVCLKAGQGKHDGSEYTMHEAVTEAFAMWDMVKERAFLM